MAGNPSTKYCEARHASLLTRCSQQRCLARQPISGSCQARESKNGLGRQTGRDGHAHLRANTIQDIIAPVLLSGYLSYYKLPAALNVIARHARGAFGHGNIFYSTSPRSAPRRIPADTPIRWDIYPKKIDTRPNHLRQQHHRHVYSSYSRIQVQARAVAGYD